MSIIISKLSHFLLRIIAKSAYIMFPFHDFGVWIQNVPAVWYLFFYVAAVSDIHLDIGERDEDSVVLFLLLVRR